MFQTPKFNAAARAIPACKETLQGKIASVTDSSTTSLGAIYIAESTNYALVVQPEELDDSRQVIADEIYALPQQ